MSLTLRLVLVGQDNGEVLRAYLALCFLKRYRFAGNIPTFGLKVENSSGGSR